MNELSLMCYILEKKKDWVLESDLLKIFSIHIDLNSRIDLPLNNTTNTVFSTVQNESLDNLSFECWMNVFLFSEILAGNKRSSNSLSDLAPVSAHIQRKSAHWLNRKRKHKIDLTRMKKNHNRDKPQASCSSLCKEVDCKTQTCETLIFLYALSYWD